MAAQTIQQGLFIDESRKISISIVSSRDYRWKHKQLYFHYIQQGLFSLFLLQILLHLMTRGPWWSYIAHLTKQICIFTVEVSAKFTALGFLYKLYSTNHPHPPPPHPRPCFFTNLDDLNWILKEGHQRNISAKLYWNWSSGLKGFI